MSAPWENEPGCDYMGRYLDSGEERHYDHGARAEFWSERERFMEHDAPEVDKAPDSLPGPIGGCPRNVTAPETDGASSTERTP